MPVKPLCPFSKDSQTIVYREFIDYQTGEIKQGSHYFRALCQTILDYANHPEHKFDGDVGLLERRHIVADDVTHIGKEANNIDEQALEVRKAQKFIDKAEIMKMILSMSQKVAEECGVDRKTFQRMKQRINEKGNLNLNTPAVKRIESYFFMGQ